jgi:hypothetical protein
MAEEAAKKEDGEKKRSPLPIIIGAVALLGGLGGGIVVDRTFLSAAPAPAEGEEAADEGGHGEEAEASASGGHGEEAKAEEDEGGGGHGEGDLGGGAGLGRQRQIGGSGNDPGVFHFGGRGQLLVGEHREAGERGLKEAAQGQA